MFPLCYKMYVISSLQIFDEVLYKEVILCKIKTNYLPNDSSVDLDVMVMVLDEHDPSLSVL